MMLLKYTYFFILLLTILIAVKADEVSKKQAEVVEAINKIMCKDVDRPREWFDCIKCCQAMVPYNIKGLEDISTQTRRRLYQDPDLNEITKQKMCNNPEAYAETLKYVILDLKGDLKGRCAVDDAMWRFFKNLGNCFTSCNNNPLDKSNCKASDAVCDEPKDP
ncbi:hypothetical protein BGZ76_005412 [Entomortierella beljakovae]|nr:hypothetical protein BGZ76_005412 [Entomortierella beljakovae]